MAARPSWEGHLRLSLVTCPVALYPATSEAETVRFNLINPGTGNRIKMKTVDAGTGEEVSRGDLVKGFAIAKDEYVLLDPEDFEKVKLESTRIVDIEKFVPRTSIDRLYWDTPYHLVPSGKTGLEAFAVIRAAMEKKGHGGDRPAGDEHPRADLRHRDRGGRPAAHHPAHGRGGARPVRARRPRAAQARRADAGDRGEDRRAAVGRLRPGRFRRPLRGRAARHDRGEEEGPCRQGAAACQRRRQGDRPDGGPEAQPQGRRRAEGRAVVTTAANSQKRASPKPRSRASRSAA